MQKKIMPLKLHTNLILVIVQILTSNSTKKLVSLLFSIHIMSSFIFFMLYNLVHNLLFRIKMHWEVHYCSGGVSIKNYEPRIEKSDWSIQIVVVEVHEYSQSFTNMFSYSPSDDVSGFTGAWFSLNC